MHSVLTAVQLLWVNLIMDTLAALALATDPPTPVILERKPAGKKAPLITMNMWKMIIGQAIFQLVVTFILYFAGARILKYDLNDPTKQLELNTMVFNTFVWMQIFNEFNNRRLDNKFNIFTGLQRNFFFIGVNCVMIGAQVAIIFVGGRAFEITPIDGKQWAICVGLAAICLPWAILIRLFPDESFHRIAHIFGSPIRTVFRACRRFFQRVGKKMPTLRKKKSEKDVVAAEESEEQQRRERSGTGSDASIPEIVVGGENEKSGVKDVEKGV